MAHTIKHDSPAKTHWPTINTMKIRERKLSKNNKSNFSEARLLFCFRSIDKSDSYNPMAPDFWYKQKALEIYNFFAYYSMIFRFHRVCFCWCEKETEEHREKIWASALRLPIRVRGQQPTNPRQFIYNLKTSRI